MTKIAIPLHGKMSSRVFHQPLFRERLNAAGFEPFFFLSPHYFRSFDFDPKHYFELGVNAYDGYFEKHVLLQQLKQLRRFMVLTETTDLRFREMIEEKLFTSQPWGIAGSLLYVDGMRQIPKLGRLLAFLEKQFYIPKVHGMHLKEIGAKCVLTPGIGYYGF